MLNQLQMTLSSVNKKGFPPLINKNTRILILGSLPGNVSIQKNEYYAHPRNQFWEIIFTYFKTNFIDFSYKEKCELLLKNYIGLWDVYAAERISSLDIDIKLPIYNDINNLISEMPNLEKILLNGKLSQKEFLKQQAKQTIISTIKIYNLPSTSAANAQLTFLQKYEYWKQALDA